MHTPEYPSLSRSSSMTLVASPPLPPQSFAPVLDEESWLLGPQLLPEHRVLADIRSPRAGLALQIPAAAAAGGLSGGLIGLVWGGLIAGQVATVMSGTAEGACDYADTCQAIVRYVAGAAAASGATVGGLLCVCHDRRTDTLEAATLATIWGCFAGIGGGWLGLGAGLVITGYEDTMGSPWAAAVQASLALLGTTTVGVSTTRRMYTALVTDAKDVDLAQVF